MAEGGERFVFRSTSGRWLSVGIWAILALFAVAPLVDVTNGGRGWGEVGLLALIALAAWEAFWRPRLVIDDEGLELVNVLRTSRVPWTMVVDVDTRWALTIVTPRHRFSADAAPAPGSLASARGRIESLRRRDEDDRPPSASERAGTDSGDAAVIVRARWRTLLEAGRIEVGRADADVAVTRLHVGTIAAFAALGAATLLVGTW